MARPLVQNITFPLSASVSTAAVVRPDGPLGLHLPTVTSGSFTIQTAANVAANSADFLPFVNTLPGSGSPTFWWGAGSLSVTLPDMRPFPSFRLVSSNPQSAVRSLSIVAKG